MTSLQGHLLVASPKLTDPNFFRAVILIVQHNQEGALGLVLNRPLGPTIRDVWDQVSEGACEADGHLHRGGPCEGPLMLLHTDDAASQIEVAPGVHFTTEKDDVERLVHAADPDARLKFFVGYAGWSPGQLEGELEEKSWVTAAATAEQIFLADTDAQWDDLRRAISRATAFPWIDPKFIPDDPSVN